MIVDIQVILNEHSNMVLITVEICGDNGFQLVRTIFVDQFTWTLPIKVVQSFANACISTHLSHIIDSINNSFLISWIFEVQYLRLSQIAPWLTRKLHKSDLSGTFIDSNKGPFAENCPKEDDKAYLESFLGLFQALQQW